MRYTILPGDLRSCNFWHIIRIYRHPNCKKIRGMEWKDDLSYTEQTLREPDRRPAETATMATAMA